MSEIYRRDAEHAEKNSQQPQRLSGGIMAEARLGLSIAVPLIIWFVPLGLEPPAQRALAVSSFMIIAWITAALDYAIAGFIGCYLFWALGIAKFDLAFSGFATDIPWFLFGALLLG